MVTLQIETVNRVGITHDVIACFITANIDIQRMEVKPHYIFLKIPEVSTSLISSIQRIEGVQHVQSIPFLPSEIRENQMNAILAAMSDGILTLDESYTLRMLNRAAADMLHLDSKSAYGKPIPASWKTQMSPIKRVLKEGSETLNVPIALPLKNKGTHHFVANYFPIQQGVLVVLKDMKQIHALIESVKKTGVFHFDDIIHQSEEMKRCIETARRVAKSHATIFLHGETGTGKDLFARAIHFESFRTNGPFVPINCAAIPENLLESELFGYEEGSFTGASKGGKLGLLEMGQGGTLFLDEIGELPLHLQAKLLRVLEDRTIRRVGGHHNVPIDVRIIAATNRNLAQMTTKGEFREDLFYRLNVIPIHLPALRERISDIPILAEYFLKKLADQLHQPPLSLRYQALVTLQAYHWPGNVRELQNVIERSVYLCSENQQELTQVHLPTVSSDNLKPSKSHRSLKDRVEAYEKGILEETLQTYKTARQAAAYLGLSHTAVLKKMKKYRLEIHNETFPPTQT